MGKGGQGGVDLAEKVLKEIEKVKTTTHHFMIKLPLEENSYNCSKSVWRKDIEFAPKARKQLAQYEGEG